MNSGFSRIIGDQKREQFFGVNEDIAYLARWLDAFVGRQGRWTSPKYLIGESYGTNRVSGLAQRLQGSHWMYLNGVILVSPTDLGVQRDGPVGTALTLPYYAATAWYHKALAPDLQSKDLDQLLPEVEQFTINELVPALVRAGSLELTRRDALVKQVARYSGLKEDVIRQHSMAVPTSFFWKELLRDRGLTVGRLDSRYRGLDREDAGDSPDFDPALTSWNHAFAPAINHYLREQLGWKTDPSTGCSARSIRGTGPATRPESTSSRPWDRTRTCISWFNPDTSTAAPRTSTPNTRCGTWTRRAGSRTG